jgi:hypothetical protein
MNQNIFVDISELPVYINSILSNIQTNLKYWTNNVHFNAIFFCAPQLSVPFRLLSHLYYNSSYRIHLKTGVRLSRTTECISFHMQQNSKCR